MSNIEKLVKMVLITYSARYAKKVCNEYWKNTDKTHDDMKEEMFNFYFEEIIKIIRPKRTDTILDYGCGGGEISSLFKQSGYRIKCCDISPRLVSKAKSKGLDCYVCDELISNEDKFDIIFINNAFFYIHPHDRYNFLKKMINKLNKEGRLYIFDEPDFKKKKLLNYNKLINLLTSLFPVYQIEQAGFFNKTGNTKKIGYKAGFKNVEVLDSWCNYRSHYVFYK